MFRTHVLKCRCHQRNEFNYHHWEPTVTNAPLGKFDDLIPKSLNVDICKTRHSPKFSQSLNNMKVLLLSQTIYNPLEVYQNIDSQGNMNIGGPQHHIISPSSILLTLIVPSSVTDLSDRVARV